MSTLMFAKMAADRAASEDAAQQAQQAAKAPRIRQRLPPLGADGLPLAAAGLPTDIDQSRGLDHGAWAPLMVAWPEADIPVVQLSVQTRLGTTHHYRLGQILAPLREEGVLIVGSGSFTHDLASLRTSGGRIDAPEPDWVHAFAEWMTAALFENRVDDLLNYRRLAPQAAHNHPTEEHLLPLYVALGVAPDKVNHLHQSTTYGILRMDAFAFG